MAAQPTLALREAARHFLLGSSSTVDEFVQAVGLVAGDVSAVDALPRAYRDLARIAQAWVRHEDEHRERGMIDSLVTAAEGVAADLLVEEDLPAGFVYPRDLLQVHLLGPLNLRPWYFLISSDALSMQRYLRERSFSLAVVPFAQRGDCDDLACFHPRDNTVVTVDLEPPVELMGARHSDFRSWLHQALDDAMEF